MTATWPPFWSGPAPWANQLLSWSWTVRTAVGLVNRLTRTVFDKPNGSKPNPFPFFFPPLPNPTTAHFPLPSNCRHRSFPTLPQAQCRGLHVNYSPYPDPAPAPTLTLPLLSSSSPPWLLLLLPQLIPQLLPLSSPLHPQLLPLPLSLYPLFPAYIRWCLFFYLILNRILMLNSVKY